MCTKIPEIVLLLLVFVLLLAEVLTSASFYYIFAAKIEKSLPGYESYSLGVALSFHLIRIGVCVSAKTYTGSKPGCPRQRDFRVILSGSLFREGVLESASAGEPLPRRISAKINKKTIFSL